MASAARALHCKNTAHFAPLAAKCHSSDVVAHYSLDFGNEWSVSATCMVATESGDKGAGGDVANLIADDPFATHTRLRGPDALVSDAGSSLGATQRMSHEDLEAQAAELRKLPMKQLSLRWRAVFARKAPEGLTRALLFRVFVYRLQAEINGDLSPATINSLDRLNPPIDKNTQIPASSKLPGNALKPGSVLVREYSGTSHCAATIKMREQRQSG